MEAKQWDEKYSTEEFIYTKVANRFFVELCENLAVGRAIDLAGGEGRNSIWLAKKGWQVENIDFSRVALEKFLSFAKEEAVADKCIATRQDGTEFNSKLEEVELGVIAYLQISQVELAQAITNLASRIAPGGHLVGVWHSRDNLVEGFGGPRDPDVLPSVETVTQALAGSGLEIISLSNREGQIQTRDGLKPSVTLVLLAQRPL